MPAPTSLERFWARIEKTETCWLWTGKLNDAGYGLLNIGGRPTRAHRLSWEIHFGPLPLKLGVLHRCDVRNCVNPEHLFLGSQKDNAVDMAAKGRSPQGERNPFARLNEVKVREIRATAAKGTTTYAALAEEYGVSMWTILRVVNRQTWQHVA